MEGLRLSIIVPVYNVELYIRTCMESIFKQQLDEDCFEVIIVNDGTQDRSMEVIEDIIAQHTNITVINQENQGLSVARNNGIALAKGEYIIMPDSDDLLIENSLKPLLDKAIETKADLVVADFLKMNDEEIQLSKTCPPQQKEFTYIEKTGEQLFLEDLMPNEYYVWRTMFRREFLIDNKITFYPGITFQDVPFTHECYLRADLCLRTHWLLNIYRRGHFSASSPQTFNLKKAHDFCTAITETWKLRHIEGISPTLLSRLGDEVYTSYQNLFGRTLHGLENYNDKVAIMWELRQKAPDLRFSNGIKQRIHSLFFRTSPHLCVIWGMLIKRYVWH